MGKTQVHVQVEESRKEAWQNYAGDDQTLSDLIRRAMAEYMAEDSTASGGGLSESVENDISTTRGTTENIQSQVKSLSDRFDVLENHIQDRKEIKTLANEVYLHLPTHDRAQEDPSRGSASSLSESLSETPAMIQEALDTLLTDSYNVHKEEPLEGNRLDEPVYWKESGL